MDQAVCDELPPPWRNPAPEKRWYRRSVRAKITDPWLAFPRPVPSWLTRQTTRCNNTATTQAVTAGLHPDTLVQAQTPLLADLPSPNSCETALHIEGLPRLQHVVARARQLVRERLGRHHAVRPGLLALEEAFRFLAVAASEVRRLDECHTRYAFPFLVLPAPFFLPLESRALSTQRA